MAEVACGVAASGCSTLADDHLVLEDAPDSYDEAITSSCWRQAMQEEYSSLVENETWELSTLTAMCSASKKAIGSKWIFKIKTNPDGSVRHKVRLVIKGYKQELGVDFGETWAPVAKLTSLRMVLALAAKYGLMLRHMDVTTAFLNPRIDSLVFMDLPPGTDWLDPAACIGSRESVCRLLKALYGLKQAPRLWFKDIDTYLQSIGFKHSSADPNLFTHTTMQVILLLYVDDILIASITTEALETVKRLLHEKYKMVDLGPASQFLGLKIRQTPTAIHLSQARYTISTILRRFDMTNSSLQWMCYTDCNGAGSGSTGSHSAWSSRVTVRDQALLSL